MQLQDQGDAVYSLHTYLMRSNSAVSDRSWLARLAGLDKKWGFEREFVQRDRHQTSPTADGTVWQVCDTIN